MCRVPFKPVAVLACAVVAAQAQEPKGVPRVLLDRELHGRTVQLVGLDERTVAYEDVAGLLRNEPVSEYLAILPPLDAARPEKPAGAAAGRRAAEPEPTQDLNPSRVWSIAELTDGQRFFGDMAPAHASKDLLRWSHPTLGLLEFKLDQLRRVRLNMPPDGSWTKPPPPTAPDPKDDTVVFANGDRIAGFVEGLSGDPRQLSIVPADKGAAKTVALDVVREVVFANPAQTIPAHSTLIWLRDGSVIACRAIKTSRLSELSLSLAMQDTEASSAESAKAAGVLRLEDLLGAAFEPGALVALCSLPPGDQKPLGERRWTRAIAVGDADRAVLGAGDIELPGPISVTWSVPAGAARFAAEAELPRQMWAWGDCDLVVTSEGGSHPGEVFRAHLNAEQPTAHVAATLEGARRLNIRVEAGAYGAVQNRVLLHRPLLLIEKNP